MQVTFLNAAGTVLFVRDDMEQGTWTQEEYTVDATFPYDSGKVIQRGQRIAFRDPATNTLEFFEIRNVQNIEPEHYQQIIAEGIVVSELSDEHCDNQEIEDKTAAQALGTALTGTLWAVGNSSVAATQSAKITRGSVWQAIQVIATNWNAYITPRVTVDTAGNITGRYLDIAPAQGTWRGLRLSIDKNMNDSSVTYDDTEVITAMYGYGGSVEVENQSAPDTQEELTFADITWTATGGHPAKPNGQKYLEYPEKTALYGRNGRPRFGYYQNSDIDDAETLLEKTWEVLQTTCDPKISIRGTVSDLYRLGYADQPLRLHDIAIVEIRQTGEKFQKEIIKLTIDLVDPTATVPEIGDYIPNIIYINTKTEEEASGGGGGGGRGQTNDEHEKYNTYYDLKANTDETGSWVQMVVGKRNGDLFIKAGEITLSINATTGESTALIDANHVNISATNTAYTLAGAMHVDANGKLIIDNAGGMYVERTESGVTAQFGVWDQGNLTGGIMAQQINGQTGQTITRIIGDVVVIGNASTIDADYRGKTLDGTLTAITSDFTSVNTLLANKIEATDINATTVQAAIGQMSFLSVNGLSSLGGVSAAGQMSCNTLSVGGHSMMVADAAVSSDGTTLVLGLTNGGSITFRKGDVEAAYDQGWNDCIDAATLVTRYTRTTGTYGGNDTVHYILQSGQYTNVGSGWWKTTQANAYTLPNPRNAA